MSFRKDIDREMTAMYGKKGQKIKGYAKHDALKGAMTGATRKRAMKVTKNFENLRPKGRRTHDILKKYE